MITEIAHIQISPGTQAAFEAAVAEAVPLFQRAEGCHAMHLEHSIEQPEHYRLVISWATLENHTVDFRESADFQEWRRLVGGFFAVAPEVGHTKTVLTGF